MSSFYVLKYKNKYYAPYQSLQSYESFYGDRVDVVLTDDLALAVRFGNKETALYMRNQEIESRIGDLDFDPKQCRVVKVNRKSSLKTKSLTSN